MCQFKHSNSNKISTLWCTRASGDLATSSVGTVVAGHLLKVGTFVPLTWVNPSNFYGTIQICVSSIAQAKQGWQSIPEALSAFPVPPRPDPPSLSTTFPTHPHYPTECHSSRCWPLTGIGGDASLSLAGRASALTQHTLQHICDSTLVHSAGGGWLAVSE